MAEDSVETRLAGTIPLTADAPRCLNVEATGQALTSMPKWRRVSGSLFSCLTGTWHKKTVSELPN
jgi:hypothetical protein